MLKDALDLLRLLSEMNHQDDGGIKVPYETFYIPEIVDVVDVKKDYISWHMSDNGSNPLMSNSVSIFGIKVSNNNAQ